MNFLSVLYAKAGITVDGVTTLNNTATGLTPATNDNSTKLATTGYVKNQNYYPYPTGTTAQYVRGDGSLATFSQGGGGGGSSVNYYLNGGTSQGTIGGNTYYEMSKIAVIGTAADFNLNADGYIAQFVTDAGDPALLNIPGGNWNFEMFFSTSSSGGTPSFYVELYKYDGTTLTLISSGSTNPESITSGTATDLYLTSLAVPTTTLTLTDRLAVRVYVNHSGRTITLHTQNGHLCQIITTFTTGLTALNGLTAQVQNFAVGAGGLDFNISSVIDTHTFNLPTASATKRGALSSIDWSAFDAKVDFGDLSATSPLSYNGSGVFSIAQSSASTNGYLSSTDWTTFNNKQDALTNPVTGTGTTNYVTKWISGSAVGNSLIYDDGTYIGIGTTSPLAKLHVVGSDTVIRMTSATVNSEFQFNNTIATSWIGAYGSSLGFYAGQGSVENVRITSAGNVGIGTTSPSSRLHIYTTASNPFRMVRTGGSATDFGFEIGSGDVGFYNYSSSTYGWYLTSANRFGLGTTNPQTKLEVYGGHGDTTARLYSTGNNAGSDASLDMWASEPGVSYDGSGIGNNVNGHPFYGRRNSSLGQSYIRFYLGEIILYTGATNANIALTLATSGVATFKNNIILNSAGSDRFTVTTDGVVNWNPSGIGGFLTWDTGKAIVGANNSYALSFYTGGSERLIISGTTGAATFASSVTANSYIYSAGRTTTFGYRLPDWQIYNTSGGALAFNNYTTDFLSIASSGAATFSSTVNATSFTASNRTILTTGGVYDNATNGNNSGIGFGSGVLISTDGAGSYSAQNLGSATYPWYSARFVDRVTSLAWTTTGRNYSNEWIEFPNASGLYSPINGAHFYPNTGSTFGAWALQGTRNSYNGISFQALSNGSVILMVHQSSAITGFYNDSYGWQFYWNAGTLFVSKGTYGAGTIATVLDSVNYATYLNGAYLPLTGGTLTGTLNGTRGLFSGSTGETLTAQGIAGEWTANFRGAASTGNSYGLAVFAGTNASDISFAVYNQSITTEFFIIKGNGTSYFNGGNVLIGTSTDAGYKLDVNGTSRIFGQLTILGSSELGSNATDLTAYGYKTRISGASLESGGLYYGSYGNLILSSNQQYTASAKRFMITNALDGNKFAIVRSVDAVTDPSFGLSGVLASGTADFVINNAGAATFSSSVTATNFIVPGGTSAQFLKADGSLDSSVYLTSTSSTFSYTASVTLSPTWQNTGVSSVNLGTGAYLVTCYANDWAVGGQYNCTYTGVMYFYAGGTNSSNTNEIVLHHSGHADEGKYIYLRTLSTLNADGKTYLQISSNSTNSGASNYQFTFKKLL